MTLEVLFLYTNLDILVLLAFIKRMKIIAVMVM